MAMRERSAVMLLLNDGPPVVHLDSPLKTHFSVDVEPASFSKGEASTDGGEVLGVDSSSKWRSGISLVKRVVRLI